MKSLSEIKTVLSEHKQTLFTKYLIRSLAIFGSFARAENNEESDLDILVEIDPSAGILFIDLADELENIVGEKVDLVSKKGIKSKYFDSIKSDLIYV